MTDKTNIFAAVPGADGMKDRVGNVPYALFRHRHETIAMTKEDYAEARAIAVKCPCRDCTANHLSLIANAVRPHSDKQDEASATLLAENLRSLFTRYPYDHDDNSAIAALMSRRQASARDIIAEAFDRRLQ